MTSTLIMMGENETKKFSLLNPIKEGKGCTAGIADFNPSDNFGGMSRKVSRTNIVNVMTGKQFTENLSPC